MKTRFFFLAILAAVSSITLIDAQSAQAQEARAPRGARFDFAPNRFKVEQPNLPRGYDAPSTVKAGAMPRSSNFLGVDPSMLASRPAPVQAPAPVPVTQVSHKLFVPNTAFHPSFGQPVQPMQAGAPMQMAALPKPVAAIPQVAAPTVVKSAAPVHAAKRSVPARHHVSTGVSGKLRTPIHPTGQTASPASYGNNVGYVPGGYLPAQSGYGTRADVHGRIMH
ncbi:MAG: hypothetical protein K2X27_26695 [Candidatus Obscuribacterales bacterium]|nr:hypothetical protein [Candidatus Obscuribacterales bacterium]